VDAEDETAADSDDGSTAGSGRRDRGGAAKKTVAPLKIKINKKKKKRRGSDVRDTCYSFIELLIYFYRI